MVLIVKKDDSTGNAEGANMLEADGESEDQMGVGAAEGSMNNGVNAGQNNGGNGGRSGNLGPPNGNNNNNGGVGLQPVAAGMLQVGYLSDGTRYSIPFYGILILIGLIMTNVLRLFQEDIRSANDLATYIDQEALDGMLEKDDYGLNTLSMVKQQKLQAFPGGCTNKRHKNLI